MKSFASFDTLVHDFPPIEYWPRRMRSSFSSSDRPGNGRYPESMKKTITPSDHRSTSVEYAPVSTSGAMYDVVPQHSSTFWPGSWMIASPKSITLSGAPGSLSLYSRFSGFRSR